VYEKWWYNKNVHFTYQESIPIARALARKVMEALGREKEGINPVSVHAVQVPEISEEKPSRGERKRQLEDRLGSDAVINMR